MHKHNRHIILNNPFLEGNPRIETVSLLFNVDDRTDLLKFNYNIIIPNFCPFENKPSNFTLVINTHKFTHVNDLTHFGVVFQCPSCQRYCVMDYVTGPSYHTQLQTYKYNFSHPYLLFNDDEFNMLSTVSPHFKDVYIQSAKAEYYGLNHIYIMGYRRSLEYLVTGYLEKFKGYSESKINHQMLGKEISNLNDSELQSTARVASYIGNDHTHVYQQYPELGSRDMKQALKAFAYRIMLKVTVSKDKNILKKEQKKNK